MILKKVLKAQTQCRKPENCLRLGQLFYFCFLEKLKIISLFKKYSKRTECERVLVCMLPITSSTHWLGFSSQGQ